MQFDRIIALRNDRTIFRNSDRCIKIFNPNYPMTLALKEALNCTIAETAGIPVPRVLDVTRIDNSPAIVFEYIAGKTLEQLYAADNGSVYRLLRILIDVQSEIHRAVCPRIYGSWPAEQISSSSCFCHYSLDFSNIVLSPAGKPYVLDWETADYGEPALDKEITHSLLLKSISPEIAKEYLLYACQEDREKTEK